MTQESKEFLINFIEGQECKTCPILKHCDNYEDTTADRTGKYESLCDIFKKIAEV